MPRVSSRARAALARKCDASRRCTAGAPNATEAYSVLRNKIAARLTLQKAASRQQLRVATAALAARSCAPLAATANSMCTGA
jgi:hypothetical protein